MLGRHIRGISNCKPMVMSVKILMKIVTVREFPLLKLTNLKTVVLKSVVTSVCFETVMKEVVMVVY